MQRPADRLPTDKDLLIDRVHCFGPRRMTDADAPLAAFEPSLSRGSYAHTVFEKVELPELEADPRVSHIFLNGSLYL